MTAFPDIPDDRGDLVKELRQRWPEFWCFLVLLDRILRADPGLGRALCSPESPVAPVEAIRSPTAQPGKADRHTQDDEDIQAHVEDAGRMWRHGVWDSFVRHRSVLTEKEWTVAFLRFGLGLPVETIAEHFAGSAEGQFPRTRSAVYALLKRAEQRVWSAVERERRRAARNDLESR